MNEETVTIPLSRFEELLEAEHWLTCLENAGVDNWSGIDVAADMFEEENRE